MGEMAFFMVTFAAAKDREEIMKKTKDGRERRAGEGYFQGRPPYARTWDKKAKAWGVDREKAAIYKRLFVATLERKSTHAIAAELNEAKVPPPRADDVPRKGKRKEQGKAWKHQGWTSSAIRLLIRNRSAIGETTSMGLAMKCPPIVDRATFDRANAALKEESRSGRPPTAPVVALLRRIAVCSVCGSAIWVRPSTLRSTGYPVGRPGPGPRARAHEPSNRTAYYYVCRYFRTARTPECHAHHAVPRVDENARGALLEWLGRKVVAETGRLSAEDRAVAVKAAKAKLAQLVVEGKRLGQAARTLGVELIQDAMDRLVRDRAEAEAALARAEAITVVSPESRIDRKARAEALADAREAKLPELRELLVGVAKALGPGSVVILPGGHVEIRATAPRS